ncbi:MAG TPA: DUF134 domain-containing protein [Candidatus Limiplasma sp.]|nr:DUF134 domain-containing protein [Candidatus Limiplasma sp.]
MARPTKWRQIEHIPTVENFIPSNQQSTQFDENILKLEELEAIRLKDLEGLEQEECAEKMQVSRPTFQRILLLAREKVADSLIHGKAIRIEGGNFTRNICPARCLDCGHEWTESFENMEQIGAGDYTCPKCGSKNIVCGRGKRGEFCKGYCRRHGRY